MSYNHCVWQAIKVVPFKKGLLCCSFFGFTNYFNFSRRMPTQHKKSLATAHWKQSKVFVFSKSMT